MGKYVNSRRLNFLLLVIAVIVTGLNIALLLYRQEEQNKKKEKPGTV